MKCAHIVLALDELWEVVDEILDDALLVGHDRLVQWSVAVVIASLGGDATITHAYKNLTILFCNMSLGLFTCLKVST